MIVIGKVQEIYRDNNLPTIMENVLKLDQTTKDVVLKYLKKGKVTSSAPSTARDVLTGEKLGFSLTMQSDGEYAWRSDTVHYFEKYDLDLGSEFIGHVMNKTVIQSAENSEGYKLANRKLLKHQKAYGFQKEDIEDIETNLGRWEERFEKLTGVRFDESGIDRKI